MSDRIYTNEENLEELKRYFNYKFDLDNHKNKIMVFCNNDFWFSARNTDTMDKIDNIKLTDIYKSCNEVESNDELFYDEEDLLEEMNQLVDCGNIVEYMMNYMEEVYGANCILE